MPHPRTRQMRHWLIAGAAICTDFLQKRAKLADDFGLSRGDIPRLPEIGRQVIQFGLDRRLLVVCFGRLSFLARSAAAGNEFPIAFANRQTIRVFNELAAPLWRL